LGAAKLSIENAAIFIGSPEQVADRIESLLRQHPALGKHLALQVHVFDGVKLMDFSSPMTLKHIPKAVRDELKMGTTKNVATIVRFG
jgi:hypothetical protein